MQYTPSRCLRMGLLFWILFWISAFIRLPLGKYGSTSSACSMSHSLTLTCEQHLATNKRLTPSYATGNVYHEAYKLKWTSDAEITTSDWATYEMTSGCVTLRRPLMSQRLNLSYVGRRSSLMIRKSSDPLIRRPHVQLVGRQRRLSAIFAPRPRYTKNFQRIDSLDFLEFGWNGEIVFALFIDKDDFMTFS